MLNIMVIFIWVLSISKFGRFLHSEELQIARSYHHSSRRQFSPFRSMWLNSEKQIITY
jgi:hypothetical protein